MNFQPTTEQPQGIGGHVRSGNATTKQTDDDGFLHQLQSKSSLAGPLEKAGWNQEKTKGERHSLNANRGSKRLK